MLKRRWYELRIMASAGALRLRQTALQRSWGVADSGEAEMPGAVGAPARIVFGARLSAGGPPDANPYAAVDVGRADIMAHEGADAPAPGIAVARPRLRSAFRYDRVPEFIQCQAFRLAGPGIIAVRAEADGTAATSCVAWTNERFLSTPHRVRSVSGRVRYAILYPLGAASSRRASGKGGISIRSCYVYKSTRLCETRHPSNSAASAQTGTQSLPRRKPGAAG